MAHTFLYTTETEGKPTTLKFKSHTPQTLIFEVTVLTEPAIQPFEMRLDEGGWQLPEQLPEPVKALEPALLEAAEKFTRS